MSNINILSIIKKNIGNPVFVSRCGSQVFETNTNSSDFDFKCFINNINCNDNEIRSMKLDKIDFFYTSKNVLYNISTCSSIFFLYDLNSIIYAEPQILNFIENNKKELQNIAPIYTYNISINNIEHDKEWGIQYRQIQFAEILKNFYYTGDFSKSLVLSDDTKKLYRELKDGKVLSESEMNQHLDVIYTKSFKDYFGTFSINRKLHSEFASLIKGAELNESN